MLISAWDDVYILNQVQTLQIFQIQHENSMIANDKKHSEISTLDSLNIKTFPNYY